jgi:hypothetical protein
MRFVNSTDDENKEKRQQRESKGGAREMKSVP